MTASVNFSVKDYWGDRFALAACMAVGKGLAAVEYVTNKSVSARLQSIQQVLEAKFFDLEPVASSLHAFLYINPGTRICH
jgi:hypothetical protein